MKIEMAKCEKNHIIHHINVEIVDLTIDFLRQFWARELDKHVSIKLG